MEQGTRAYVAFTSCVKLPPCPKAAASKEATFTMSAAGCLRPLCLQRDCSGPVRDRTCSPSAAQPLWLPAYDALGAARARPFLRPPPEWRSKQLCSREAPSVSGYRPSAASQAGPYRCMQELLLKKLRRAHACMHCLKAAWKWRGEASGYRGFVSSFCLSIYVYIYICIYIYILLCITGFDRVSEKYENWWGFALAARMVRWLLWCRPHACRRVLLRSELSAKKHMCMKAFKCLHATS